jgi:hypothetical protein
MAHIGKEITLCLCSSFSDLFRVTKFLLRLYPLGNIPRRSIDNMAVRGRNPLDPSVGPVFTPITVLKIHHLFLFFQ